MKRGAFSWQAPRGTFCGLARQSVHQAVSCLPVTAAAPSLQLRWPPDASHSTGHPQSHTFPLLVNHRLFTPSPSMWVVRMCVWVIVSVCVCVSVYRACLEGLSSLRVTHKSQMMLREKREQSRASMRERTSQKPWNFCVTTCVRWQRYRRVWNGCGSPAGRSNTRLAASHRVPRERQSVGVFM